MGSMLEPRSRRGERFIFLCAVRAAHRVGKIGLVITKLCQRVESVARQLLFPSATLWWIPPRRGGVRPVQDRQQRNAGKVPSSGLRCQISM